VRRRHFLRLAAASTPLLFAPGVRAAGRRVLRIYLARHGETDWNHEGRVQGALDIPLNDTGRQQAALLRTTLAGIALDGVYASTLARSRETAQIATRPARVTTLADLRERNQGRFQGGPVNDPDLLRRQADPDDALDGGESLTQLAARAGRAIERIRREHRAGTVLVVAHSITNRMILADLLGFPIPRAATIQQANDELYLIELETGVPPRLWKLIREKNLMDL